MAGMMYLGNQKVTPVIVQGGAEEPANTLFKIPDNVTTISGTMFLSNMFYNFKYGVDIDLNNLEVVSKKKAFSGFLVYCNPIKSLKANKNLILSGDQCFEDAFNSAVFECETNFFSKIEEISGSLALNGCCVFVEGLPNAISFDSLTRLTGENAFNSFFMQDASKTLYFPALTSSSFGSNTNQFYGMLMMCDDCVVHFPSNLQPVIGSWSDVLEGFGGFNTTILFDLEATS